MSAMAVFQLARSLARSTVSRVRPGLISVGTGTGAWGLDVGNNSVAVHEKPSRENIFASEYSNRIPESVSMLISAKVTVPSVRLRDDLPWTTLTQSPLLAENPELREEVTHIHERLITWAQLEHAVSPSYALEILQKFGFWLDLHEVHSVIHASPEVRQGINDNMKDLDVGMDKLQELYKASLLFMKNGEIERAKELCTKAIRRADRIHYTLSQLEEDLKQALKEDEALFRNLIITAAATGATLALIDHIKVDGAISIALSALKNLLGVSCAASVGYSVVVCMESYAMKEYMKNVKAARKSRDTLKNKLEDLIDDVTLHSIR